MGAAEDKTDREGEEGDEVAGTEAVVPEVEEAGGAEPQGEKAVGKAEARGAAKVKQVAPEVAATRLAALWRRRREEGRITELTDQLIDLVSNAAALDAAEFHMPQFAHMIIALPSAATVAPWRTSRVSSSPSSRSACRRAGAARRARPQP